MLNLVNLSETSCIDFTKYLLGKGADPNMADFSGNRPLHQLAGYSVGSGHSYNYNSNPA